MKCLVFQTLKVKRGSDLCDVVDSLQFNQNKLFSLYKNRRFNSIDAVTSRLC